MITEYSLRDAIVIGSRSDGHALDELARIFGSAGHELVVTGGAVRNALLGAPIDDIDFSTDAAWPEILRLLGDWSDRSDVLGNEAGTVRCSLGELTFDFTPYCTPTAGASAVRPGVPVDLAAISYTGTLQSTRPPTGGSSNGCSTRTMGSVIWRRERCARRDRHWTY